SGLPAALVLRPFLWDVPSERLVVSGSFALVLHLLDGPFAGSHLGRDVAGQQRLCTGDIDFRQGLAVDPQGRPHDPPEVDQRAVDAAVGIDPETRLPTPDHVDLHGREALSPAPAMLLCPSPRLPLIDGGLAQPSEEMVVLRSP